MLLTVLLGMGSSAAWAVSAGDTFTRISSISELSDGDEVIFVNQAETYACGTAQNTNNRTPVSITVSNHSYTYVATDNVQVFVVKIDPGEAIASDYYGFHTGSGYIYSASNSSNYLRTNTTSASEVPSGVSAWSLSIDNDIVTATNESNGSYYLAFNGTSYFSQYKSGQSKPYIFKKVVSSSSPLASIALSGEYPTTFLQGDAFSHEGMTVTAIYDDDSEEDVTASAEFTGYDMSTTGNQTVTVSYTENEVTKTADYNITVNAPVSHNVTWSVNGETTVVPCNEGAAITFPEDPADISGKTFVGWVAEAIAGSTNEPPTFVTSATMGTSDVTYYAVFAYASGGGSSEVVDVLNYEWAGVTGTNYSSWSGNTATSSAVYAGNTAGGNDAIQLRSNNNNSGIVTTTSGGKATKLTVKWNGNTSAGRTLNVYGKNSAYSTASDLYNSSNQGTLLGTIVYDTSTELTIDDDYEYIGIRSASGALYLDKVEITWSTGGGVSYSDYCTTVVAATVAKPVITVASSFTFSTSVEMSCETDGATIYYTLDGTAPTSSSTEYDGAFSINATTTIKAIAIKGSDESEMTTVAATKNLAVPTVTIDATGITNTNVFDGTEAGSLAATVTYNEAAVEGAVVTWSGDNDEVATIDASTGDVTLVAAGTVTFTATYAGNSNYSEKAETYVMTVTNTDPNAPGTENNPYSVADAIAATPASGTSENVYITGIVSAFYKTSIMGDGSNYRYYISDDGGTDNQLLVYKGKGLGNVAFSDANDLQLGDVVTIYGGLTTYSNAPEVAANNYIVSLERTAKCATPTFNPAAGEYTSAQNVEISCATEDVTIYYTTDGTDPFSDPTAEPSVYAVPIAVDASMTIKAVAVKDGYENSDIAEAVYTIITTPVINADDIQLAYDATSGEINYTIDNELPGNVLDATTTADWISDIEISVGTVPGAGIVSFTTTTNDNLTARTATVTLTYGDISKDVTVEQAGFVVDYAELPFAFNDGKAAIEETTGLTQNGLGSDYASAPKLKFDTTGDNLVLKINERPGTLTFDIKGNSFSGGTFKVQTSEDGTVYSDLETYTGLGDKQEESFDNLGENVRYIKWIYTSKNNGNVALGNIALAEYVTPAPAIVAPASVELKAEDTDGTIDVTYNNIADYSSAEVVLCDSEGNTTTYDWIYVELDGDKNVYYVIAANTGDERTGYLKVKVGDVTSDIVTITQAKYAVYNHYTKVSSITSGKHYVIANVDGTKAMGAKNATKAYYDAEDVTVTDNKMSVDSESKVQEFVIYGPDVNGLYAIYDPVADGYIYASSSSSNDLDVAATLDNNGLWEIDFDNQTVTAQGTSTHKLLRYNSGSPRFSCYQSGQTAVAFYEKDGEAAPTESITIGAAGYTTYTTQNPISVPSGVKAYIATAVNASTIHLEEILDAPARTPIILQSDNPNTYDLEKDYAGLYNEVVAATPNILKSSNGSVTGNGSIYALGVGKEAPYKDIVGFYVVNDGQTVPAGKAYLDLSASSVKEFLTFDFGELPTGLNDVRSKMEDVRGEIFNLAGQKMNRLQKGINIVNGKKIYVK